MKDTVNAILRKLGLEIHGVGYLNMIRQKDFKKDPFESQKKLVQGKKVSTIVDLGGHIGGMSLKYHKAFPDAQIYPFEPFPESYEKLVENTKAFPAIHPIQAASSNHNDGSTFFVNTKHDTNSLLKAKPSDSTTLSRVPTSSHAINVETMTLDSFALAHGIDHIDILKMDIQGAELQALQGAEGLLKEKKIGLIFTEIWFNTQYENQSIYLDLGNYLQQFDYYLSDFFNAYYLGDRLGWADAIFLAGKD